MSAVGEIASLQMVTYESIRMPALAESSVPG
jgi:hypothetical protein